MRKLLIGLAGAAALAMGSAASATITVDASSMSYTGPTTLGLDTTIGYSDTGLGKPTFTEWLTLTDTLSGIYSITLDTSSRAVDFTSAYLTNGVNTYDLQQLYSVGSLEGWGLGDTFIAAGQYTLFVNGNNSDTGSLAGTITITDHGVPEPATWMMMLLGFGAIGWQLRRRRTTLAFAQAV